MMQSVLFTTARKVTPHELMTHVLNDRSLAGKYADVLEKYYLLHWNGSYLRKANKQGVVIHQDDAYFLIFKDCTPETAYHAEQVRISFRKLPEDAGLPNYAMVTIITEPNHQQQ